MKTEMKKVLLLCLSALLLSGALLTGCGSAGGEAAANTSSTADTTSADGSSTDELTKLKLQTVWLPQGQFMGYYVAQAKGYYADEGIDLEIIPGSSDISPEDQVENGVVDLGVAFYTDLLTYQEAGYDMVNVAQIFQQSPLRLIAKKGRGITTGADLAGKKVGNWFGGQQYELYALCGKYGIDRETGVDWIQQDFTMDAFYNDELDAASVMVYNEYHLVLESGMAESDFTVIDMNEEGIAMLEDCLFVKGDWAEANHDLLVSFLRATIKGWQYACENPEEAGQICWDAGQSVSLEHQISMCQEVARCVAPEGFDTAKIGYLDPEALQQTIDLGVQNSLISAAIPIDDSVDETYWEEATAG
ncbi:MAG: ABC transporter substrate-binding protein [Oscillospiraceae bacterium]